MAVKAIENIMPAKSMRYGLSQAEKEADMAESRYTDSFKVGLGKEGGIMFVFDQDVGALTIDEGQAFKLSLKLAELCKVLKTKKVKQGSKKTGGPEKCTPTKRPGE